MELEDDELRILARIDNVVERQLRLLQIEERKHIHLILDLRDKLNDANLAVHTRPTTRYDRTRVRTRTHTHALTHERLGGVWTGDEQDHEERVELQRAGAALRRLHRQRAQGSQEVQRPHSSPFAIFK